MRAWAVEQPGHVDGGPLRPVERAVPEPAPAEVLVEVSVCGVCRTDLHVAEGDPAGGGRGRGARAEPSPYPFAEADRALADLAHGRVDGAAVLLIR